MKHADEAPRAAALCRGPPNALFTQQALYSLFSFHFYLLRFHFPHLSLSCCLWNKKTHFLPCSPLSPPSYYSLFLFFSVGFFYRIVQQKVLGLEVTLTVGLILL